MHNYSHKSYYFKIQFWFTIGSPSTIQQDYKKNKLGMSLHKYQYFAYNIIFIKVFVSN